MDDTLLSYYNRELSYVRKLGAEFSEQHPKIAGRLRLDSETVEDPHVSRLIESYAFLTARIRQTIDDSFPELTEALMGVLYPEFHAPYPAMSIAQIRVIRKTPSPQTIECGRKLHVKGEGYGDCVFSTCNELEALPVTIENTRVVNAPAKAPNLVLPGKERLLVKSVLSFDIKPFESAKIAEFKNDSLSLYIDGQSQLTFKLFEYLMQGTIGIAIAKNAMDPNPICLPANRLVASGLLRNGEVYGDSFDGRTCVTYKKIMDFFAFPKRVLFVVLVGMREIWPLFESGFSVYFYFDETDPELVQGVDETTLQLGCVPIVNLYEGRIEYIGAKEVNLESKLEVHRSLADYADVHHVSRVYAKNNEGETKELLPFYGSHRQAHSTDSPVYWGLRRENTRFDNGRVSAGTDTYISFVDTNFEVVNLQSDWLIGADVICNNRDVAANLPFGSELPHTDFIEGGAGMRVKLTIPATSTISPKLKSATRWQLIAQLTLQSFAGKDGLGVLKESLRLYDLVGTRESQSMIDGIINMHTSPSTARIVQQGRSAICQGTKIELEFDEQFYSGSSVVLFGHILDEFFAQFCAINSFTQLSIKIKQKPGRLIECPPRIGFQQLI